MRNRISVLYFPVLMFIFIAVAFTGYSSRVIKSADSAVSAKPDSGSIEEAMKEFENLSRHDKKMKIREIKKAVKEYKAQKKAGDDIDTNTLLLIVLAILIPPLAVYLHEGETNNRFWISVLLTVLGYVLFGFAGIFFLGSLPGIIYALYVVLSGT